jgi:hypothetical protein
MSQVIMDALAQCIGGNEIGRGTLQSLRKKVPAAYCLWQADKRRWAVFVLTGNSLSAVDAESIRQAAPNNLIPLLVVEQYEGLMAAASIYREVAPHMVYPIAGKFTLIQPPSMTTTPASKPVRSRSRVPLDLLKEVEDLSTLPTELITALTKLRKSYERMLKTNIDDNMEEERLLTFAKDVLTHMGLDAAGIRAAKFVRTIEREHLGPGRDHFFHSFQNYFLGLTAIARLPQEFLTFKELAKVNWDVAAADVWFLTALWHDVGYAAQKFSNIFDAAFGSGEEDIEELDIKDEGIQRLLARPAAQHGIRAIASLMARLLNPLVARTQWLEPGPNSRLGGHADRIVDAIKQNFLKSHGALSAIRLYCDYNEALDNMVPEKRELLRQTVLLACVSMPFHDFWFRKDMRDACSECKIRVAALPFAALLAFVDSIQDDRRNLAAVREALLILEKLLIVPPRTVEARINIDALESQSLLDKIIEARDVLAALDQHPDEMEFKYPAWVGV